MRNNSSLIDIHINQNNVNTLKTRLQLIQTRQSKSIRETSAETFTEIN